jgi:hypothetical protein
MYSRRMDSWYRRTVRDPEAAVQFSSFRDGWTRCWCSSFGALDARGRFTSADPTTEGTATAVRIAAGASKRHCGAAPAPGISEAAKVAKITPGISKNQQRGSVRKRRR